MLLMVVGDEVKHSLAKALLKAPLHEEIVSELLALRSMRGQPLDIAFRDFVCDVLHPEGLPADKQLPESQAWGRLQTLFGTEYSKQNADADVRLVEHIGRVECRAFTLGRIGQLVKHQEQLERIDAARIEVVVAVLAVVEVEATEFAELRKARHDHFDIGVRCMVAQIDQAFRLFAQRLCAGEAGAPVGDCGGVERRLEQFMFDQQVPAKTPGWRNAAGATSCPARPWWPGAGGAGR